MQIDPTYTLHETEHWLLNHHLTSRLPGYLMLGAKAPIDSLADGAELTLFVWRELGESLTPPAIQGPSVDQVIANLRTHFA